jgi:ArsR family transcriptional regulator
VDVDPCCPPLLDGALDEARAAELAEVLKVLGEPVRLRMVSLIAAAPGGELCACDLPALVARTQPTTSHHLSQLVRAGILRREQRGRWAWFSLEEGRLESVAAALRRPVDVPEVCDTLDR